MAQRSRLVFTSMFLLSLAACSGSEEFKSGVVIPSAQASEAARSLYPALGADAEEDRSYDYH